MGRWLGLASGDPSITFAPAVTILPSLAVAVRVAPLCRPCLLKRALTRFDALTPYALTRFDCIQLLLLLALLLEASPWAGMRWRVRVAVALALTLMLAGIPASSNDHSRSCCKVCFYPFPLCLCPNLFINFPLLGDFCLYVLWRAAPHLLVWLTTCPA